MDLEAAGARFPKTRVLFRRFTSTAAPATQRADQFSPLALSALEKLRFLIEQFRINYTAERAADINSPSARKTRADRCVRMYTHAWLVVVLLACSAGLERNLRGMVIANPISAEEIVCRSFNFNRGDVGV